MNSGKVNFTIPKNKEKGETAAQQNDASISVKAYSFQKQQRKEKRKEKRKNPSGSGSKMSRIKWSDHVEEMNPEESKKEILRLRQAMKDSDKGQFTKSCKITGLYYTISHIVQGKTKQFTLDSDKDYKALWDFVCPKAEFTFDKKFSSLNKNANSANVNSGNNNSNHPCLDLNLSSPQQFNSEKEEITSFVIKKNPKLNLNSSSLNNSTSSTNITSGSNEIDSDVLFLNLDEKEREEKRRENLEKKIHPKDLFLESGNYRCSLCLHLHTKLESHRPVIINCGHIICVQCLMEWRYRRQSNECIFCFKSVKYCIVPLEESESKFSIDISMSDKSKK